MMYIVFVNCCYRMMCGFLLCKMFFLYSTITHIYLLRHNYFLLKKYVFVCHYYWESVVITTVDSRMVQCMSITTKAMNLIPTHDKVYLIQHCIIKFVIILLQGGSFTLVFWLRPLIKIDLLNIFR